MQEDFVYFAETCFKSFGDRVKHWITINEPNLFADMAYIRGRYPPAHCSEPFGSCPIGNSDVEPLLAMHNMLLAHGKAAKLYRDHFQKNQGGVIGIVVSAFMYKPLTENEVDLAAANRALAFNVAWSFDPLIFGDYPPEMRHYHGDELPSFSPEEKEIIKGSIDFIGLNHYSTFYVKDCISSSCALGGDRPIRGFSNTTGYRDGVPIGDRTGMANFFVVPRGMEEIVNYVKDRYHNKPMYVLENGYSPPNQEVQEQEVLNDVKRIEFHKAYLASLAGSIRNGADVRGYFVWTLMDNYEWVDGYGRTFGLYYIDRKTLRRTPKQSALCFNEELEGEDIERSEFPDDFFFGTSTSSYQIEGAYHQDGKRLSNWDVFTHTQGGQRNGANGDVANDHYHRYLEDIAMTNSLGVNAYRFSISWTRVLPRGRFGAVNPRGVTFYNDIIDNLLLQGIEPFVTINHNDFPQELEERYGSWLSPLMQEDFVHFAKTCFESFGDRVKYWITINEPNLFAALAYKEGMFPPSHCSEPYGNCSIGNSTKEPLISMHNMLLAHARAVKLYREHFQGGSIGIVAYADMYEPLTDDDLDREAASRVLAFNLAWVFDPLSWGDYPPEMRRYHGNELPRFSAEERNYVKGSIDFIGINHYSTLYAKDCIHSGCNFQGNGHVIGFSYVTGERNGVPIGEPAGMEGMYVVPRGMEKIIEYLKKRYHNKPTFVLENGYAQVRQDIQVQDSLFDLKRVEFHKAYLASLARAIRNGADVRGYFIWTLMDDFEWLDGYNVGFGLYYVDRKSLQRIPKLSANWYKNFLTNNSLNDEEVVIISPRRSSTFRSRKIEGAYLEDGKRLNNWDFFNHWEGTVNGDVADDHYHRYLLKIKIDRVSIYAGIEPFVTINQEDFPQELEERYGSWFSPLMQEDFVYFAETCFKSFGDRVKYWVTINEPNLFADSAYLTGSYPPAHCSEPFGNCPVGNSDVEPLVAMHNMILAHAKAVKLYRNNFQKRQGGVMGINVATTMYEPLTENELDLKAANRALAFDVAWALDPLVFGDYPSEMRRYHEKELRSFSAEEKEYVKGSIDFIGLNHYSTSYAKDCIYSSCPLGADRPIRGFLTTTEYRDGVPIGDLTGVSTFFVVPRGMEEIVNYLKDRYHNKPMYVLENGYSPPNQEALNDVKRIEFHKVYLASLARSIRNGANVRGYFIWTLMDDYEWAAGYGLTFGLYYIDRQTLKRTPKQSASWYRSFLTNTSSCQKEEVMRSSFGNNTVIASRVQAKAASM
ncbi:hypothetical protein RHMOL_Rhmol06G0282200 [Rhododendron molle]|uniref:Uncharacterized protein n=1 Tax=Rhododendron molle TaxID=49168 RepID=A0ACC0NIL2_RHOML|nr:hypothetical protein RHMOL_Rhmol06G0282200 [Rhododendron molle]